MVKKLKKCPKCGNNITFEDNKPLCENCNSDSRYDEFVNQEIEKLKNKSEIN